MRLLGSAVSLPTANLRHWWDVSNASSFTFGVGTKVAQWNDLIGGKHFVQATEAAQPARTGTQNGRSTLVFGGDPVHMTAGALADWKFLHNGDEYTIMAAVKFGTVANPEAIYGLMGTTSGNSALVGVEVRYDDRVAAGNNMLLHQVSCGSVGFYAVSYQPANVCTAGAWHVLFVGADPDNATASSRTALRVDGGAALASNAASTAVSTANPAAVLHLGSVAGPSLYMVGEVAELLIYTGILSDAVRDQVEVYLAAKWAITVA
ncbi:MAG: hypothetical protein IPM45_18095 [Acidimicrobiales bacterium]|nr:hypothetical protein [Acidimicrobiales bacterium]